MRKAYGNKKVESKNKTQAMTVIRHIANILLATVLAATAFLFIAYGLSYKGLNFISEYFDVLLGVSASAIFILLVLYYIFYFLQKQSLHRLLLCGFICLDIFAAVFYGLSAGGIIDELTSIDALRDYIDGFGGTAVFIYIIIQFLQVVILPIPGSVSVAVGVALFGPFKSAVYSLIGILAGSLAAFFIGRVLGYKAVCWIVGKEDLDKWLKKVRGKDYLLLTVMFLLPLFPDDVLCFIAGLSSMTTPYFIVMILITRIISVFTTSYSLDIIPFDTWWGILIWLCLFAAIAVSFILIYRYSDRIDRFLRSKFRIGTRRKGEPTNDKDNGGEFDSESKDGTRQ